MITSIFKKYGDNLIFALALAVLAATLFFTISRRIEESAVINIVFTQWWQSGLSDDSLSRLVTEFESQNPGIRVTLNHRSFEDARSDIFDFARRQNDTQDEEELLEQGEVSVTTPLADVLALDPLWVPELLAREIIESSEAPIASFINVLYYNIDVLRQAGFARPPANRGEFLAFARTLAENGVYALGLALYSGDERLGARGVFDTVYPWIWAASAPLLRDGNPALTAAPLVATLAFLASLYEEGLLAPGAFSANNDTILEDFVSGRTAFMVAPTKHIAYVRERMGSEAFSITAVPPPNNHLGLPFFAAAGWVVGVYSGTAHLHEARMFAAFLSGRPLELLENTSGVIPPAPTPDPLYARLWEIALSGETAWDFSAAFTEAQLEAIFAEELARLFSGEMTPAQTAAAIQGRWLGALE